MDGASLVLESVESALAKLRRAQSHLADLRASVDRYRAAGLDNELTHRMMYPYGDRDPRAVVILRLELRAPSEWSPIMGDILTNLRAALDHAIYAHGVGRKKLNSGQRKNLYHPINLVSAEWDSVPAGISRDGIGQPAKIGVREKLRDLLAPAVLDVIERNQPFNDPDGPHRHGLAILSALVNQDKHRALLNIPIKIGGLVFGDGNIEIMSEGKLRFLSSDTVEKHITIRRRVSPPGTPIGYKLGLFHTSAQFLEQIELPNTGGQRLPFIGLMEKLVTMVERYLNELKSAGC